MGKLEERETAEVAVCEIVPRAEARPDRLKALGRAIARWQERMAQAEGAFFDRDFEGVSDLLQGELPQPLALRAALAMKKAGRILGQPLFPRIRDFSDAMGNARSVLLVVHFCRHERYRLIVANILAGLPGDAIAQVLIDGETWQDLE